ncbi:MAG TPA: class I lanthipeptide [Candidatus Deferrimicrobium sp.]|nr:class I lanthipeptide [Candidatus Deferrimicrobium sp.]
MKFKKIEKKLKLSKETIVNLDSKSMSKLFGGSDPQQTDKKPSAVPPCQS